MCSIRVEDDFYWALRPFPDSDSSVELGMSTVLTRNLRHEISQSHTGGASWRPIDHAQVRSYAIIS